MLVTQSMRQDPSPTANGSRKVLADPK
jgi:hypothetical protein